MHYLKLSKIIESEDLYAQFMNVEHFELLKDFYKNDKYGSPGSLSGAFDSNGIMDDNLLSNTVSSLISKNKEIQNEYGVSKFLVFDKENKLIGTCGFSKLPKFYIKEVRDQQLINMIDKDQSLQFGYRVSEEFQGKGYATKISKMIVNLFFENEKNEYIIAGTDKDNIASQKILWKNNFTNIATVNYENNIYPEGFLYVISRQIFEEKNKISSANQVINYTNHGLQ